MAAEVAQKGIVVCGEVTDAVVFFCAGVDDGGGVVGEAGEVGAVFLTHEGFYVFAFFGIVEEEGVVGAGGQAELARIVKVKGRHRGFGLGEFELLVRVWLASWKEGLSGVKAEEGDNTLVGRKVPMTSEVFWTSCGPPGGGGGTTRGPAIVGAFNKMVVR